jgi:hypothetical protein
MDFKVLLTWRGCDTEVTNALRWAEDLVTRKTNRARTECPDAWQLDVIVCGPAEASPGTDIPDARTTPPCAVAVATRVPSKKK